MTAFTVTYDYLCPFARIANEAIVDALEAGADYDVTFAPFSLTQVHLEGDDVAVWDQSPADAGRGVLALLWSLVVRDDHPDRFRAWHRTVYDARFEDGADIGDPTVLADVAVSVGLDPKTITDAVASGIPSKRLGAEHSALVEDHAVFGVPTFIAGDEAVFVRLMERHNTEDLDRVVQMVSWANLNEFKRTRVPR